MTGPKSVVIGTPGVPGHVNVLTQDVGTSRLGRGSSAQSCLVEVERWTEAVPEIKVLRPPEIVGVG